jgi:hypothetical protein
MEARPPEFGEQTEEVLAEFGFGAEEAPDQESPGNRGFLAFSETVIPFSISRPPVRRT